MIKRQLFRGSHVGRTVPALLLALSLACFAAFASDANAAACSTSGTGLTTCTIAGSIAVTSGGINIKATGTLGWPSTALSGTTVHAADTNTAQQTFDVIDATGQASGWNITASATAFTSGPDTLPAVSTGIFTINGDPSNWQATTAPGTGCSSGATGCAVAVLSASPGYPVTIGTSATKILSATATTGIGSNTISNIGWWIALAPNTKPGTYTSTITLATNSGP